VGTPTAESKLTSSVQCHAATPDRVLRIRLTGNQLPALVKDLELTVITGGRNQSPRTAPRKRGRPWPRSSAHSHPLAKRRSSS
jgi:hypothetical protein